MFERERQREREREGERERERERERREGESERERERKVLLITFRLHCAMINAQDLGCCGTDGTRHIKRDQFRSV